MLARPTPPFRADHVGSLLRPRALLDAREGHAAGRVSDEELALAEDVAIIDAVDLQREAGLVTVTDGEFRRTSGHPDDASAGLVGDGPVRIDEPILGEAFDFLTSVAPEQMTPKLSIPSPGMVHQRDGEAAIDPLAHPDVDQFWEELSAAYASQVRLLADRGCRYLQLDDTGLAYLNDPEQRAGLAAQGRDAEHEHERYIRQINAALGDRPDDLTVTTHLCRGNHRSSWAASGGYDFVAEALFGELDVDGFFLEYDDERTGGFEALRFVPPGKQIVLGLVTTKSPVLERKDDLKRRIDQAAEYVPLDQLCLSPQCGFSSTSEGSNLTQDEEFAKLRLVVEVAQEVWG